MKLLARFSFFRRSRKTGVAIVVVLSIIVLLTVVVIAFFTHATEHLQVEASRANRARADVLAHSAGDYSTGQFLQEIIDPSRSTVLTVNGVSTYTPSATGSVVAQRILATAIPTTQSNFFNLVRQSVPTADTNASSDNSAAADRNGRTVGLDRWNLPALLVGQGFTTNSQLPDWIYMTPDKGPASAAATNDVGRFAYNVYDVGGLLNANAVGYPSSLSAAQIAQLKGTPAGADLTQLSASVTATAVNALAIFRNPTTAASASAYLDGVAAFNGVGFLKTSATSTATGTTYKNNNYFTGRQDLLRYVRTQNPALTNALPYLTHYSRTLNAPSTPTALVVRSPGGNVVHYKDNGTIEPYDATTSTYSYQLAAGDPLIARRFSLAKLAWLTYSGPKPGITNAAIQACFGLAWNNAQARWDYVGPTGSTPVAAIEALTDIAAESTPREPNFFETLKAGIVPGSIGLATQSPATVCDLANPGIKTYEGNSDLQILQIGANIIDCSDSDNYPTILCLGIGASGIEVAGVEDLPYFHSLWMNQFQTVDSATAPTTYTNIDLVWVPEFLNPHLPSNPSGPGPAYVQADMSSGSLTFLEDNTKNLKYTLPAPKDLSVLPAIKIPSASFETMRTGPQPMVSAGAPNSVGALVSYLTGTYTGSLGFLIFSWEKETSPPWKGEPVVVSTPANPVPHSGTGEESLCTVQSVMMRLQYPSPTGPMKTYARLAGYENAALTTGLNRPGPSPSSLLLYAQGFIPQNRTDFSAGGVNNGLRATLWDPRTNRIGPCTTGNSIYPYSLPNISGTNELLLQDASFAYANDKSVHPVSPGLWPQGGLNISDVPWYTNIQDPVTPANILAPGTPSSYATCRPADAWLAPAANPYRALAGSGLDPNSNTRPVILQRPFRSVAELGYVFRDEPWKTLNFFDATSGDSDLLDLFSVADSPAIIAGRTSLESRQPLVQQAILNGTAQSADGTSPLANPAAIATAFQSFAYSAAGAPNTNDSGVAQPATGFPATIGQFVSFLCSKPLLLPSTGAYPAATESVKYRREAVVRAFAGVAETRPWNLLIDVVAQSGRFPTNSTASGANFSVEGEQRYWVFVAIDRYTGKVIDQQWESVDE